MAMQEGLKLINEERPERLGPWYKNKKTFLEHIGSCNESTPHCSESTHYTNYEKGTHGLQEPQEAKSMAFRLRGHAIQKQTATIAVVTYNTRHALHFHGTWGGGRGLGVWRVAVESGRRRA
eukprot:1136256-Pelagomonas_calceolata.AAC.1